CLVGPDRAWARLACRPCPIASRGTRHGGHHFPTSGLKNGNGPIRAARMRLKALAAEAWLRSPKACKSCTRCFLMRTRPASLTPGTDRQSADDAGARAPPSPVSPCPTGRRTGPDSTGQRYPDGISASGKLVSPDEDRTAPERLPDQRRDRTRQPACEAARKQRLNPTHGSVDASRTTPLQFRASSRGAIAQLGERLHGMQEVGGSIPPGSTTFFLPVSARPAETA